MVIINDDVRVEGTVYANGPVIIQGQDIRQLYLDLEKRILSIEMNDLPALESQLQAILENMPTGGKTTDYLQKLLDLISAGESLIVIQEFLQEQWLYVAPVVVDILNKIKESI